MKRKRSNFTVFAILTTITLLTWVIFDAYQSLKKTEFETIPPAVLAPLVPSLDQEVLANIEEKRTVTPEEVSLYNPAPQSSGAAQEEATPSSEASPSAQESEGISE